jgi:SAM-dependent methyltransferase
MPFSSPSSQPEDQSERWLQRESGRQLLVNVQRTAVPELTRVFGQYGLYLRPSSLLPVELSGNMLGNVVSLHRSGQALAGRVRCLDSELPIASASLSLVYSLLMLESSPTPAALMAEFARVLKPEGVVLLISLNPWSPVRLRYPFLPSRGLTSSTVASLAIGAGLDVIRRHYLGPFWSSAGSSTAGRGALGWLDGFRAASLVVLRRHEAALTPLRKASAAVSLRPGMSAG